MRKMRNTLAGFNDGPQRNLLFHPARPDPFPGHCRGPRAAGVSVSVYGASGSTYDRVGARGIEPRDFVASAPKRGAPLLRPAFAGLIPPSLGGIPPSPRKSSERLSGRGERN